MTAQRRTEWHSRFLSAGWLFAATLGNITTVSATRRAVICDRLKANPFTRDIPVMFVTAMDQERQEARGLALGAVDYIAKPVNTDQLLSLLRVWLHR